MRRIVVVHPAAALAREARLFAALERAFPVSFVAADGLDRPCDAAIVADATAPPPDVPTLVFERGGAFQADMTLTAREPLDRRLWGVTLPAEPVGGALSVKESDIVLAGDRGSARWVRTPGTAPVDRIYAPLPSLAGGEVLRDALGLGRALGAIVLIDLLRRITHDIAHVAPRVRATLLFDDPNLRWRSYGYIDYRDLARHAGEHGYHVAMAMIPLDASRPHGSAVSLFRRHSELLSLVVHGNNHEKLELMQPADLRGALELGAQALRRVRRFELASGIRVGPIMVPPHGLCSRTMAQALAALPFDALCAAHPFPWTEHPPADALLAGWGPASFAEGCAVIPRLPFGSTATEVALRAYMDHPIVLYGHHEDVATGLDVLADAAERVNRLGDVEWTSIEEIACGNTGVLRDGGHVSLQAYSHLVRVPAGAESLTVAAPESDDAVQGWSFAGEREIHPFGRAAGVPEGATQVRLRVRVERDPSEVSPPRRRVWPRLRRIATESRDRLVAVRP